MKRTKKKTKKRRRILKWRRKNENLKEKWSRFMLELVTRRHRISLNKKIKNSDVKIREELPVSKSKRGIFFFLFSKRFRE